MSDDTIVVNIAEAINKPHAHFNPNPSATAKTGIDESFLSAKTIVCSIKSIANRNTQSIAQVAAICLYDIFLPSSDIITPPNKTSSPLYKIGFEIINAVE